MRHYKLWSAAIPIGMVLIASLSDKLHVPQPVADTRTEQAVPETWTFTGTNGRQADISMPILQRFHYAGDVTFCAKAVDLQKASTGKGEAIGHCAAPGATSAAERAVKLAETASELPLIVLAVETSQTDTGKEDVAAFSLSALREAMETVPRDAPQVALLVLERYWTGSLVENPEGYYNPAFLFKNAFITEIAEARFALCGLVDDPECMAKMPPDAADAAEAVGRWKSDIGKLMFSIDLAEAAFQRSTPKTAYSDIYHAQDLASSYGYASEIAEGDGKLLYLRRGLTPLEKVYERYKEQVDAETMESLTGSLGTIYGRVAFISREKADVERAIQFDQETARREKELDGNESWQTQSNLGDSHILRAEVLGTEDDFRRGLEVQREALAKAEAEQSTDGKHYVTMKLAQSLVRYASVDGTALSRQERIDMLKQGKEMATAMLPVFQETGTTTYQGVVNFVLQTADLKLRALGEIIPQADWQPSPPPQKP